MAIGIITGSGTYALPGLDAAEPAPDLGTRPDVDGAGTPKPSTQGETYPGGPRG